MEKRGTLMEKHGTPKVGYMGPDAGPFRCGSCKHFCVKDNGTGCDDKEVIVELGAGKSGLAPVDENGCCNEFQAKKKEDTGSRMLEIVRARKQKK